MSDEVLVAADKAEHAVLAAELLARAVHEAVQERGVARVALSGGSTPSEAYQRLAAMKLPFDAIRWFWVDERAVPTSSDRSNFAAAMRDFGVDVGAADGRVGDVGAADGRLGDVGAAGAQTPKGRFHRMRGDAPDLAAAAAEYAALLRAEFGVASAVAFDALVLGVGDDGHTASLFPGLGVVSIADRLVTDIPAQPKKELEARITLTAPTICEARLIVVLARGAAKKAVLEKARAAGPEDEIPSRLVQRAKHRVVWLVDAAAAPA